MISDPAVERLAEFRERVRGIALREELDSTVVSVLGAFEDAGVGSLLLKGPVLARVLYTADEQRGYCDIDLLVAPTDLPQARRALAGLGFRDASQPGIDDIAGVVNSETWLRPVAGAEDRLVLIDLHWRLPGCKAPPEVAWCAFEARRTWIDLEGSEIPVLDHAGLALHLAAHAAQHGPGSLKAMADLTRGVERWPPEVWRSAAELADEVEATAAFAAGLRLAPTGAAMALVFGLPETDETSWEILHREIRPRGTFHLRAWSEAEGARERADILRRSLLPAPDWIRWEYPEARRGKGWLAVGYTRHLLRAPGWAARAWRFRRRAQRDDG